MRVIFMGTPQFAVKVLEALLEEHEVVAVFTKPDKKKGRGKMLLPSPVKELALRKDIPIYQPKTLKDLNLLDTIIELNADVIVVAAYGLILPKEILEAAKYSSINVHASLLPKYRGAAPINRAIINGEKETGITIMQMDEGLDTGDMLSKASIDIKPRTKASKLTEILSSMGADLLLEVLAKIKDIKPIKQDASQSSYAPMLDKKMGYIRLNSKAIDVQRLVYGIDEWPSVTILFNKKRLKIHEVQALEILEGEPKLNDRYVYVNFDYKNGDVVYVDKKNLVVALGEGAISIEEVTPEGKKTMKVDAYLRGNSIKIGDCFEEIS